MGAELFINVDEPKTDDEEEEEEEEQNEDVEAEEEYEEEEEEEEVVEQDDMLSIAVDNKQEQMQLNPNVQCASKLFQKIWKSTKDRVEKVEKRLKTEDGCNSFEQIVNNAHFKTMAAAPNGRKRKFYFYAQENESLHFLEVNINLDTLKVKITIKGQSDAYRDVGKYFCYTLNSILAD